MCGRVYGAGDTGHRGVLSNKTTKMVVLLRLLHYWACEFGFGYLPRLASIAGKNIDIDKFNVVSLVMSGTMDHCECLFTL